MPYRKVAFRKGEYYHLYNRGNNFQPIFFERTNYLYFLRKVREHLTPEALDIVAYCLMPNHYHFMAVLRTDNLAGAMQPFIVAYTKAINKRHQRVGALFQGPYQAIRVDSDEYLLHLSRYIHLNPVAASIVRVAEDWEFSSYREYVGLRAGTLPKPDIVLTQFMTKKLETRFLQEPAFLQRTPQQTYREFVESYTAKDRLIIDHLLRD